MAESVESRLPGQELGHLARPTIMRAQMWDFPTAKTSNGETVSLLELGYGGEESAETMAG